ncbi:hypothetical protein BSI_11240 [Bacillus inaquosorum KCTC 13429]|uniref:Uncharacterized protein n=1 Tax=Bacillus inaquosorum KCTC 13429 TaxID=1236548 RepID=A0A9W5PDW3_9BACI|nr:hypothetical protein BSI_11240 [Bacillus inaquosorum KCTC 13429]
MQLKLFRKKQAEEHTNHKGEGTVKSFRPHFIRITIQFTGNIKNKGFLDNREEQT